ncbi:MAG: hypothetical protein ACREDR_27950, partial [Blastocatellia bacterium]
PEMVRVLRLAWAPANDLFNEERDSVSPPRSEVAHQGIHPSRSHHDGHLTSSHFDATFARLFQSQVIDLSKGPWWNSMHQLEQPS